MKEPKFDIGDVLGLVVDSTKRVNLHVIEIHTQKCPAGIEQVSYSCRVFTTKFKDAIPSFVLSLVQFNEIEVKKFEDEKNES